MSEIAEQTEMLLPGPAVALGALLDVPVPDLDNSAGLPLLWHWIYLLDRPAQADLGPDGHPVRGTVPAPPGRRVPPGDGERAIEVSPTLLFRFSALTYNAHRIHYDRDYARDVEGYPGLLTHGPLQAVAMAEAARVAARRDDEDPGDLLFDYRLTAPLFDHQGMVAGAAQEQDAIVTAVRDIHGPADSRRPSHPRTAGVRPATPIINHARAVCCAGLGGVRGDGAHRSAGRRAGDRRRRRSWPCSQRSPSSLPGRREKPGTAVRADPAELITGRAALMGLHPRGAGFRGRVELPAAVGGRLVRRYAEPARRPGGRPRDPRRPRPGPGDLGGTATCPLTRGALWRQWRSAARRRISRRRRNCSVFPPPPCRRTLPAVPATALRPPRAGHGPELAAVAGHAHRATVAGPPGWRARSSPICRRCGRGRCARGSSAWPARTSSRWNRPARPDGARAGNREFFDWLHAGHRSLAVDFRTAAGRAAAQGAARTSRTW